MKTCSELQVGDWVLVHSRDRLSKPRKIEQLTKLHIIVEGVKYRRISGYQAGSYDKWSWQRSWIDPATEDEVQDALRKIKKANVLHRVKSFDWSSLSEETLYAVYSLIHPQ